MIRGKGDLGSLTFFNRLIPNYKRKSLLSKNEIFITNLIVCWAKINVFPPNWNYSILSIVFFSTRKIS